MDLESLTDQGQPQICCRCNTRACCRRTCPSRRSISARHLTFTRRGANDEGRFEGTLVLDVSKNVPLLEPDVLPARCDGDEKRNNERLRREGFLFPVDAGPGSHHVVFGYDRFNDNIFQNTYAQRQRLSDSGDDRRSFADGVVFPRVPAELDHDIECKPVREVEPGLEPADALAVRQRQLAAERVT